ncbi:MAG: OmpA family protein [Cyclobacteriaceae bacterium]
MMRSKRLLIWLLAMPFLADAQETVHWASRVVEVSSETGRIEYSAMQALHKPNVLPSHGDNPNAWKPRTDTKDQFIVVMFDSPSEAQQVAIAESQNPGSVTRIFAYDTDGTEHLLFEMEPRELPIESRLLNLFFERTNYKIEALRVELDATSVAGDHSIDAIGISDSNIPISVLINVAALVNENLKSERLSTNVNSQYIEHSPLLSPDGKRLYFSRRGHPDNVGGESDPEDIWYSEMDEATGEWLPAKNIGLTLNNAGPNFISAIIPDGDDQILLLGNRYGKKGRMYSGVSMSRIKPDGTIEAPSNVDIKNDYNYSENADYYVATNQEVMLMAVERDDTYGNRDVYVSFKEGADEWSEPLNLGGVINTAAEESSPYLLEDDVTMFFSSSGFSGFGGADIYKTTRLDDTWTNWSEPENMGGGLNSNEDDVYFNISSNSRHAYFTRGSLDQDTDIFRFETADLYIDTLRVEEVMVALSGRVLNANTNEPIPAASIVVDEEGNQAELEDLSSGPQGNYSVELKSGGSYGLIASKEGFNGRKEIVDIPENTDEETMTRDLYLVPDAPEVPEIDVIVYFDFDKSNVGNNYGRQLAELIQYFENGGIQMLQLDGHTDSIGTDEYNMMLSERRANAVKDYLIEKGVSASQLKVVPKGESEPAVPNTSNENRAKNRRVQLKIVDTNAN